MVVRQLALLAAALLWPALCNAQSPTFGTVTSNSQLRVLSAKQYGTVTRLGMFAAGDVPPLVFTPTTAPCTLNGGTGDGGSQVPSFDGGCFIATPSDGMLHALNFPGVDPTGVTSSSVGLAAAMNALNSAKVAKLYIDKGTYLIDGNGANCNHASSCAQTKNWVIEFAPGSVLKASASLVKPVLWIDDSTSANTYTLDLIRPHIDTSLMNCPGPSGGSCGLGQSVAIENYYQLRTTIMDPNLYGGATYSSAGSEDGWTPVANVMAQMRGGTIQGYWGGGIYASGNLLSTNPPPNFNLTVIGTYFQHDATGVECKFSGYSCKITSSHFYYCANDIGAFWAGIEPPPNTVIAIGNHHKFTSTRAWYIQGPARATISNEVVEDIGYDENGANPNSSAVGLYDDGATDITFSNNNLSYKAWIPIVSVPAIEAITDTFNAVQYDGGFIHGSHNVINNFNLGFYEATSGGNAILASDLRDTIMTSVVTPISSTTGNVAGTIFDYFNNIGVFTHTVGGRVAGYINRVVNYSLAAVGTLTNTQTSAQQVIPLTGVLLGDSIIVNRASGTFTSWAGLSVSAYPQNGMVALYIYNGTGNTLNFATMEPGSNPALITIQAERGN
jgi:hypothetical protein